MRSQALRSCPRLGQREGLREDAAVTVAAGAFQQATYGADWAVALSEKDRGIAGRI